MTDKFDYFIGIDWSGAKGKFHKGISVAVTHNDKEIELVKPPSNYWSRDEVFKYLIKKINSGRILLGIDFAFSYPFNDKGSYFPNGPIDQPRNVHDLWKKINSISQHEADFYGGSIWNHKEYKEYYNSPYNKGNLYFSRRRLTELHAKKYRSPSPTFNCVGPASVGTGSLAGMRFLYKLKKYLTDKIAIWPFDDYRKVKRAGIVIVEIFPSIYFHIANQNSVKKKGRERLLLRNTLSYFKQSYSEFKPLSGDDNDDMDAIVSCAALKYYCDIQEGFVNSFSQENVRLASKYEGWIYGVV